MSEIIQFGTFTIYLTFCEDHIFMRYYETISGDKYELKVNTPKDICINNEYYNMTLHNLYEIIVKCFKKEKDHFVYFICDGEKLIAKFNVSFYGIFSIDFKILLTTVCNVDNSLKEEIQKLKDENEYIMLKNQHFDEEIKNLTKCFEGCMKKLDEITGILPK